MSPIDGIKARLASIPPLRAYQAGGTIERIIKHDMPALINVAEWAQALLEHQDRFGGPGESRFVHEDAVGLQESLAQLGTKSE